MASPQLENGHTQIANEILEHLMRLYLPSNHWQVLLCIIRKTYGFKKKVDWIANCQIVEDTGLVKSTVSRALKHLEDRKLIIRKGKAIGFHKDWERWKVSNTANNQELAEQSTTGTKLAEQLTNEKLAIPQPKLADRKLMLAIQSTKVSSPRITQKKKETITKETIQKKKPVFILPDWIDKETWEAYLEMRRKKRATPTGKAIELILIDLDGFRSLGQDPNKILEESIKRNWTGVFSLQGGQNGKYKGNLSQKPAGAFDDIARD